MTVDLLIERILDRLDRLAEELSSPTRHLEAEMCGAAAYQRGPLLALEARARRSLLESRKEDGIGEALKAREAEILRESARVDGAMASHGNVAELIERAEAYLRILRDICS